MRELLISVVLSTWVSSPPPADTRTYECKVECFKRVVSVKPLSCERVAYNVTLALYAFDKHGPLASPEVCELLSTHSLWINEHADVWEDHDRNVSGLYYSEAKAMMVSRTMDALAHEILHAYEYTLPEGFQSELGWDYLRDKPGNWVRNSTYMAMLQEYESQYRGLDAK